MWCPLIAAFLFVRLLLDIALFPMKYRTIERHRDTSTRLSLDGRGQVTDGKEP